MAETNATNLQHESISPVYIPNAAGQPDANRSPTPLQPHSSGESALEGPAGNKQSAQTININFAAAGFMLLLVAFSSLGGLCVINRRISSFYPLAGLFMVWLVWVDGQWPEQVEPTSLLR